MSGPVLTCIFFFLSGATTGTGYFTSAVDQSLYLLLLPSQVFRAVGNYTLFILSNTIRPYSLLSL